MKDVMLDIETLGTRPGSVVWAIGAVAMNLEQGIVNNSVFYSVINVESARQIGLTVDDATLTWWRTQDHTALTELHTAMQSDGGIPIKTALTEFGVWLSQYNSEKVRVWGNGADFDQPLLAEAYYKADLTPPWSWRNNRCYRTIKNTLPGPKFIQPEIKHHALYDAHAQARHLMMLLSNHNPHKYRPPASFDE